MSRGRLFGYLAGKGENPAFPDPPWWAELTGPRLREAYPGIGPWEWDARPEWLARVRARLAVEDELYQARKGG